MKKFLSTLLALTMLLCTVNIAYAESEFTVNLFAKGENGYTAFRIPSIVKAANGDLIAFAEGRKNSVADNGDIDTVMKRSTNGGSTWSALSVVWSDGANTCGNPTAVLDESNGKLWLFMTWNAGGDTQSAIEAGTSSDCRKIYAASSSDNGVTWTTPVNLYTTTQSTDTRWDATGPGNGLYITKGAYAGRIVIPAKQRAIYSDDHGVTWHSGAMMTANCTESTIVELSDGTLMKNDRRSSGQTKNLRAISYSTDGGINWSEPYDHSELFEPVCQGSAINFTYNSREYILFANPDCGSVEEYPASRCNMMVKVSLSDGKHYEYSKVIHPGASGYSSLVQVSASVLGILYENGDQDPSVDAGYYDRISFKSFSIADLFATGATGNGKADFGGSELIIDEDFESASYNTSFFDTKKNTPTFVGASEAQGDGYMELAGDKENGIWKTSAAGVPKKSVISLDADISEGLVSQSDTSATYANGNTKGFYFKYDDSYSGARLWIFFSAEDGALRDVNATGTPLWTPEGGADDLSGKKNYRFVLDGVNAKFYFNGSATPDATFTLNTSAAQKGQIRVGAAANKGAKIYHLSLKEDTAASASINFYSAASEITQLATGNVTVTATLDKTAFSGTDYIMFVAAYKSDGTLLVMKAAALTSSAYAISATETINVPSDAVGGSIKAYVFDASGDRITPVAVSVIE